MPAPERHIFRVSRLGWCGIALVLLTPWIVVWWALRRPVPPAAAPASAPVATAAAIPTPAATSASPYFGRAKPGPWGNLDFVRITIEPPEEFMPLEYGRPQPRWVFQGYSLTTLDQLWQEAKLTPAQRQALNNAERIQATPTGIVLQPDPEIVAALTPESRVRIYTVLAQFPENLAQQEPFRFRNDAITDWFRDSDVPADIVALTRRLTYYRNTTAYFSDYELVLPQMASTWDRTRYLKTLSRKSALLVRLNVEANANIDALAQYWGRGHRAKDVGPLLQSLLHQPGGASIDVAHLLPKFARSLLYTYPLPSENPTARLRDCHWTSFNFYREEPDERFANIDFVQQTLRNDYYPVAGNSEFGDIIVLLKPNGVVVHSCVFVADNIVFTKNGPAFSVPWLLTSLDGVVGFYSLDQQPLELRRYRAKR
jgi:hypothetical protein